MNYYPNNNFYQNYAYGNTYQTPVQQSVIPTLQGKMVDNQEMVKVSEVPFGGFGIFPKGDLSEIYVKSWNSNGTTQINTYKPIPVEETAEEQITSAESALLEKINILNERLDAILNIKTQETKSATPTITKEVNTNAF